MTKYELKDLTTNMGKNEYEMFQDNPAKKVEFKNNTYGNEKSKKIYVRVMDGAKSNAGGFEYKTDKINYSHNWNPNEIEPNKMGGFNFGSEDKILRWLHKTQIQYLLNIMKIL